MVNIKSPIFIFDISGEIKESEFPKENVEFYDNTDGSLWGFLRFNAKQSSKVFRSEISTQPYMANKLVADLVSSFPSTEKFWVILCSFASFDVELFRSVFPVGRIYLIGCSPSDFLRIRNFSDPNVTRSLSSLYSEYSSWTCGAISLAREFDACCYDSTYLSELQISVKQAVWEKVQSVETTTISNRLSEQQNVEFDSGGSFGKAIEDYQLFRKACGLPHSAPDGVVLTYFNQPREKGLGFIKCVERSTYELPRANIIVPRYDNFVVPNVDDIKIETDVGIYSLDNAEILCPHGVVISNGLLVDESKTHIDHRLLVNKLQFVDANSGFRRSEPVNSLKIGGTAFLGTAFLHFHYYHWFTEVLPKYFAIEKMQKSGELGELDTLIIPPSTAPSLIVDTINCFDIRSKHRVVLDNDMVCERLIHVNLVSKESRQMRPFGGVLRLAIWPEYLDELRSRAVAIFATNIQAPEFIYVSRADASRRRIANENEFFNALEKLGFVHVIPGDYSFQDEVSLFSRAKCIIGIHGAGLTNALFSPRDCHIIEIMGDHFEEWCWHIGLTTRMAGQNYHVIFAEHVGEEFPWGERYHEDLRVDVNKIIPQVERVLDSINS